MKKRKLWIPIVAVLLAAAAAAGYLLSPRLMPKAEAATAQPAQEAPAETEIKLHF